MTVAIIDYESGNLHSAAKAFERVISDNKLNLKVVVTGDAKAVAAASYIVLPGVGAFGDCRRGLADLDGMIESLNETVIGRGRPFLGICVGMQLMAAQGLEHGTHQGLGWIAGEVDAIAPKDPGLKIPHMGWNDLQVTTADHPVLAGLGGGVDFYFVHSYEMRCDNPSDTLARVDYGGPVTAVVGRDNLIGTQFHPEKSQRAGQRFIANFLRWKP
ncbi:MAG: imidazole glycerol phosphate synthase subunit HisH [Rhodospirillales bacterium]|nr:imidazole glycerol phosphate synthase subunit HisH [Rhodospirillales bacterium]